MEEGTVPNSIYEGRITLTQKPEIYRTKKENKRLVHFMKFIFYLMIFRWQNPKQNNSKLNTVMYKKNYSTQPTGNNLQ